MRVSPGHPSTASPHELEMYVTEVGMTPLQAIHSATGAAARALWA